jgi:P27 family predicted phage terminase small subunit
MPDPPNWLAGEALEMWNEIAPLLFNANVLTMRDRHALARLCKMREQYRKCIEFTDKYGLTYPSKDAQGNTVFRRHTQAIEARNLATIIARLEAAFGLEPSARATTGMSTGTQAVVTGGI